MQQYIIRQAVDSRCSFINHYVILNMKYNTPEDITNESLMEMKAAIERKALSNKSRYKSYLEMNPSLCRPNLYNRYIPFHKLCLVIRLRTVSHDLEIERARHMQHHIPQEERLCSCGEMEDEKHFLLHCNHYTHVRHKYNDLQHLTYHEQLDNINTPDFIYDLKKCRDIYLKH